MGYILQLTLRRIGQIARFKRFVRFRLMKRLGPIGNFNSIKV